MSDHADTIRPDHSRIATSEETGEERRIVKWCDRCGAEISDFPYGVIVSPRGTAHLLPEHWQPDGNTRCGRDATRDAWWWPL